MITCNNGNPRFKGRCNNCGRTGHKEIDCWLKEENANKRPPYFKVPNAEGMVQETASAAVDKQCGVEFLLCSVPAVAATTFTNEQSLLNDPNVWIADSAATVHNTPHLQGMKNVRDATKNDRITMGNGANEKAVRIGDVPGIVCNKHGNQVGRAVIRDVTVLPSGAFDLFSLTKMISEGWKLGGTDKAIWLTKHDMSNTD